MTLAISKVDIDALAQALHAAGIVSFKIGFRGPEVVYAPEADHAAIEAMRTLLDAVRVQEGRDTRRQLLELVESALKALTSDGDKPPKAAPKTPEPAPDNHTLH